MIDRPYLYPFYEEPHPRRGRVVLRPVVRLSIVDSDLAVDALVDTGSEHVLVDSTLALVAGIDLRNPVDIEQIGIGGGIVEARFVEGDSVSSPATPRNGRAVVLDSGCRLR